MLADMGANAEMAGNRKNRKRPGLKLVTVLEDRMICIRY